MAEPRGPHEAPAYLPPSIPKRLQDEDDVQNWSRWAIRSLARGAIDPATARELMSALQKYLELRWTIQGHRPAPPAPPMRQEDRAELDARAAKFAQVDAEADAIDAAEAAAAALIPQAEPEVEGPAIVVDLAGLLRAAADRRAIEADPLRAVEQAPYRDHGPAIRVEESPPGTLKELFTNEF